MVDKVWLYPTCFLAHSLFIDIELYIHMLSLFLVVTARIVKSDSHVSEEKAQVISIARYLYVYSKML